MGSLSLEELAERAEVDVGYVRRLIELGALEHGAGDEPYGTRDIHLVLLLHAWEGAGLPVQSVLSAVQKGDLSFSFLETPAWPLPERLERTYRQFAADEGIPLEAVLGLHEALGFAPPDPETRIRRDEPPILEVVKLLLAAGASEPTVLRLFRVFSDNLRRVAKATADAYQAEVEPRWRGSGMAEGELMAYGAQLGRQVNAAIERSLVAIHERHRQHVWTEYSIHHAETALREAGLSGRVPRPPAICFVDLAGYTQLTEDQGDRVAARLAAGLASLVDDISRRHDGTPIRWLGDGGMFHFKESAAAVLSALEMVESAPPAGLPPTHIGIHSGPVVFQDGDVYGRTVNIAARIAAHAEAGEVLASEETVEHAKDADVRFARVGPTSLKGVAEPVTLYRALRPSP